MAKSKMKPRPKPRGPKGKTGKAGKKPGPFASGKKPGKYPKK